MRGVWIVITALCAVPAAYAEDGIKALPTLLVKGEVVSVDTSDPSATLLKVKDRYGFETPIYLDPQTVMSQGGTPRAVADLSSGTPVEVEYNFDVNTAKRHAVTVQLTVPAAAAEAPVVPAAPVAAATTAASAETGLVTTPESAAPATESSVEESPMDAPAEETAPAAP